MIQSEKRVMLDCTLPKVLAGLFRSELERVRTAFAIFIPNTDREGLRPEVHANDARPEIISNARVVLIHDNAGRRETEIVLDARFP